MFNKDPGYKKNGRDKSVPAAAADTADMLERLDHIERQLEEMGRIEHRLEEKARQMAETLEDKLASVSEHLSRSIRDGIQPLKTSNETAAKASARTAGLLEDWLERERRQFQDRLSGLEQEFAREQAAWKQKEAEARAEQQQRLLDFAQSVIRYRDQLSMQCGYARERQEAAAERLLLGILEGTKAILEENGIEVLDGTGAFDEKLHRIGAVCPTDDPALHLQIKAVLKDGYRMDGKCIRFPEIEVYQYKTTANAQKQTMESSYGDLCV